MKTSFNQDSGPGCRERPAQSKLEDVEIEIAGLISTAEGDLSRRGVLMISRAQDLFTAVKKAELAAAELESITPADFFNPTWRLKRNALRSLETRLARIIRGMLIPNPQPCHHPL